MARKGPFFMPIQNIDDDGKLKQRFYNKRVNAKKEGIGFNLSLDEFVKLVVDANIKSSDLGIKGYHLARFNDSGAYEVGNCRFIHYTENLAERKVNDSWRAASSSNARQALAALLNDEEALKKQSLGLEKYHERRRVAKLEKRVEYEASANPKQLKENNSQYGTFWITNGHTNKKWHHKNGDMPKGFSKGRK